ncbi:MAG: sulfurtransferase [Opitutia bacterium Tous-C1TDCM]|nr:MAG: sulfurtransferase [Opitutae bacterium Tous-C1TDCM]
MKTDSLIRLLAGTVTLAGTALAYFVHPAWLLLPAFAGLNLIQSVFTGFCPPTLVLRKLGWVDQNDVIHWGGRR